MNRCDSRVRLWYLSGGMEKFGKDEFNKSNDWREDLKTQIYNYSDGCIRGFNPNEHYSMQSDPSDYTDREVMDLDIYKLRQSELVIFNNNDPYSRGSMIELGIAAERRLPVFVLNEEHNPLHCWVNVLAEKIFDNREDMIIYLVDHYMGRA